MTFSAKYIQESMEILAMLDDEPIETMVRELAALRERQGRLFILGVGGSAAHASHAVNDFRKLCGIEAYAPTDNVSELTARTNDEGWETTFSQWLKVSRLSAADALFIFSVGGGDIDKNISPNLVHAVKIAQEIGATILGIVGRDGGYTARMATVAIVVAPLVPDRITPHTEGLAAVIWHLLVSHPMLQTNSAKWESFRALRPSY